MHVDRARRMLLPSRGEVRHLDERPEGEVNRRGFLGSILAACVAPAIVRADSLMRIVPIGLSLLIPEQYGDYMSYGGDEAWMDAATIPEPARRDADRMLDRMALQLGRPVVAREYVWFRRGHRDQSDPLGQRAYVGAKGWA